MIAVLYSKNILSFVRNHQSVFQSDCSILHSLQQRTRVPVAPHRHQHLMSVFQVLAILMAGSGISLLF